MSDASGDIFATALKDNTFWWYGFKLFFVWLVTRSVRVTFTLC